MIRQPDPPRRADVVDDDLRALSDALPQLVWIARPDGYHIYFNQRWWEYTGLDPDASLGDGWWSNALHPDDRERTMEAWQHSLQTGDPYEIEYRFRAADGQFRWFLGRALPQRDEQGRIIRWFGTCTDIHAQKLAEHAIQKSEAWFRTLVDGSADMFGVLTLDGVYTYCSPSVHEQLGWLPEQLVGRSAFDFIHPDDVPAVRADLLELTSSPSSPALSRMRFMSSGGDWRTVQVRVRIVQESEGEALLIVNSTDTTDFDMMQRRVESSERMAALGRVASSMAHEFNNVLMGIQPQAELLARVDDEKAKLIAQRLQHSVTRGKTVTQQVLRFTRTQAPARRPVSVERLVENVLLEIAHQLPENVEASSAIDAADLRVLADLEQLEQAVVNLCLNARDAMPDGGSIVISAGPADAADVTSAGLSGGEFVSIEVSDTGDGIPPDLHERIFEPLFTTRKREGGSGLGLSISRQIASSHDGGLVLAHSDSSGSTFRLLIPRTHEVEQNGERTGEMALLGASRVLLVEDDESVAGGMLENFELLGFVTLRVASGEDALARGPGFAPDIALIDYALPDMRGTEVFRRLRDAIPGLPAVFVTGHADADDVRREIGGTDAEICQKPVATHELVSAMARAIRARRESG